MGGSVNPACAKSRGGVSWRYTCDVQKLPAGRRRASTRDAEDLGTLPLAEFTSHTATISPRLLVRTQELELLQGLWGRV